MRQFDKMASIMQPKNSLGPILTFRNIRCLMHASFGHYDSWMIEQEEGKRSLAYQKKVSQYKLLVTKLNRDEAEALRYCATASLKLIENIPASLQNELTES